MANTLLLLCKKPLGLNALSKLISASATTVCVPDRIQRRTLYSEAALGLDGYKQQKERTKMQLANIADRFKEKMLEYSNSESKNMVFTEDLKNMVHIAESDADIELAVNMLKKYNKQNSSIRFGNFVFGPVIMRMFYVNNKADLALQCFKSEEFGGMFDQYITYQLLLDLLYENQKYKEMLEVVDIIKGRQLEGQRYPKNVAVLAMAACYKLNTAEAFEYAAKLWQDFKEIGHQPVRKTQTFFAALALNQDKPEVTLEALAGTMNPNYNTIRNLRVAALADIGRIEDVIPILKYVINEDQPRVGPPHTFNRDVIDKLRQAVAKANNPEITAEFNRLEQLFQEGGNISNLTLEEQLCAEIQKPPLRINNEFPSRSFGRERRSDFGDRSNRSINNQVRRQRPGLADLV